VPTKVAIAYGIAILVLLALTAHGRRELPPLPFAPKGEPAHPTRAAGALWLGLGVLAGIACGACALVNAWILRRLDVDYPLTATNGGAMPALVVLLLAIGPVAEELFFRGWLQTAITAELPKHRWLAPLLAAFGFAAVGSPLLFAPMLVLGVASGFLFARTKAIGPSILAHGIAATITALAPWV